MIEDAAASRVVQILIKNSSTEILHTNLYSNENFYKRSTNYFTKVKTQKTNSNITCQKTLWNVKIWPEKREICFTLIEDPASWRSERNVLKVPTKPLIGQTVLRTRIDFNADPVSRGLMTKNFKIFTYVIIYLSFW